MDTYELTDARLAAAWPIPLHAGGDWEGVNTWVPASAPLSATAPCKQESEYVEGKAGEFADWLAPQITAALLDEATLAPKPGLVDPRDQGAHRDMHWELMRHSALALEPSFRALAMAGYQRPADAALRERIGALGRAAEAAMLAATAGVNTHRGAIWALGLLAVAAAQNSADVSPSAVAARAGALARLPDRHAPATTGLPGEQACLRYSVGGARGQAQAGFPQVMRHGLPMLWRSRRHGDHESAARLNALLAIMSSLDDTCVLARGGPAALQAMQAGARRVLANGGCANLGGRRELRRLDRLLLELNVSPGGAADLLAATLFLDRVARRSDESRNPAMPAFDQNSG